MPLGADLNAAVYRLVADDGIPYFLKLKRGVFDKTTVALPRFLADQGVGQVLAPLPTATYRFWTRMEAFHLILYPYINGQSGFDVNLSDHQWVEFGLTLRRIHHLILPLQLRQGIRAEEYSPQWRQSVRAFQTEITRRVYDDPVAAQLASLLNAKSDEIRRIVERAEQLGTALRDRLLPYVLCHADIHAGNVLLTADAEIIIVDWDDPVLAPKERDLMFVGGGVGGVWNRPSEEALFYQGYGPAEIDLKALAYYRYERIIEDIAVTCEQIFSTVEGGADRQEGLRHLENQFLPNNVVEIAHRSDSIA